MEENKKGNKYDPSSIEKKWQKVWEESRLFSPDTNEAKNPYYNLMMFPYPSAEGLHVGNMYAFTGADVYARFQRMQGKDVFEPIGLDGFGIHSENYALKVGRHPKEQAKLSEENFYRQLHSIGNSFDWKRTVETYDPNYYKWTQWLFIKLFKAGFAYRDTSLVNWCPKDLTVLSDEQVIDGKCERCGSEVSKKELEQWFFRITKYADRLLNNIDGLNWSEKVKIAQKNWIGKSEGAEIGFVILNDNEGSRDSSVSPQNDNIIKIFTTRPDTLFGATFVVISPEHELVKKMEDGSLEMEEETREKVREYIKLSISKSEIERTAEGKEKTGVFSGLYATNPVNNEKIPVWIADYVLSGYGTGAIMAVPAHDERDFEFAKKYNLPIIEVISLAGPVVAPPPSDVLDSQSSSAGVRQGSPSASHPLESQSVNEAYEGDGVLINSGEWNGWEVPKDIGKVLEWLESNGLGKRKATYHLRDWLISRQRYWGPPIPMIFCQTCANAGRSWFTTDSHSERSEESQDPSAMPQDDKTSSEWDSAGWYPVPESDLPVLLPDVSDWKPENTNLARTGLANKAEGPLANHPEFYNVACPECGSPARRETDVSDTFLDSSWYYLRYPSIGSQESGDRSQETEKHSKTDTESMPFDPLIASKWLPVNMYIGGAEHAVLHLLYSRFITMVLNDLGFLSFEEPFSTFFAHGLIIKDGAKMSKSKGNVVVPDEYIKKYGADALRAYLMFLGPYEGGGDFRDSGIEGMYKFLRKVWKLISDVILSESEGSRDSSPKAQNDSERLRMMHKTIQKVTKDIKEFGYNTAIASLMEWYNFFNSEVRFQKSDSKKIDPINRGQKSGISNQEVEVFLKLLAPFAPHMTEELWQQFQKTDYGLPITESQKSEIRNKKSIHLERWPEYDEKYLVSDVVTIVVQVNGKRRGEVEIGSQEFEDRSSVENKAKEQVLKYLEGFTIKKTIYIPGKIVNFVV